MHKLLLATTIALPITAAAQTPPAPKPAPAPKQAVQVTASMKAGAVTRTYDLALHEDSCAFIDDRAKSHEDELRICARPHPRGTTFEVRWKTRSGPDAQSVQWDAVIARGSTSEVGRIGGARFAVKLH